MIKCNLLAIYCINYMTYYLFYIKIFFGKLPALITETPSQYIILNRGCRYHYINFKYYFLWQPTYLSNLLLSNYEDSNGVQTKILFIIPLRLKFKEKLRAIDVDTIPPTKLISLFDKPAN